MIVMLGQHSGSVGSSIALHVAILAALTLTFRWSLNPRVAGVPAPIEGVLVDQAALQKEQQRREQEVQRKQREERQKREAAEQQQRDKDAADKRERDRVVAEQRQREQAERDKVEAAKKQKAEQQAREQQARDDAARKKKEALEAKQKAQAEAQLAAEVAAENAHNEAVRAGALDEYRRSIQEKIERNWSPPASAKTGLECVVNVVQLPTGDVYDARVVENQCNGDEAVKRSIEAAVKKASPLPRPPSQAVFERNLVVTFKPMI
jgi:colicin import membrane protein